jgi:hypothetical protein
MRSLASALGCTDSNPAEIASTRLESTEKMKTISGSTRWGPGKCKFPDPFPESGLRTPESGVRTNPEITGKLKRYCKIAEVQYSFRIYIYILGIPEKLVFLLLNFSQISLATSQVLSGCGNRRVGLTRVGGVPVPSTRLPSISGSSVRKKYRKSAHFQFPDGH